jgi:hypothetical protein
LQVFHANVAKVDQDVAHVAIVVHICCKLMFPPFHLFFPDVRCKCVYLDVAYVSHIYCKCFIYMLHMFHIYIVNVLSTCCICFTMAFKCFYVFLQVFYLPSDVCYNCCMWIFQK